MTEVYDVQDGVPLCKGLFRNNVDKRIRRYFECYTTLIVSGGHVQRSSSA